jgi:hypothetical protein
MDAYRRTAFEGMPPAVSRSCLQGDTQKAEKIEKYGKINCPGFVFLFSLMEKKIESSPYESYAGFLAQANKISPHGTGNKDDPYYCPGSVSKRPDMAGRERIQGTGKSYCLKYP